MKLDFVGISSYVGTKSSGEVRITHDFTQNITAQNVLLVEDIVDTGSSIDFLLNLIKSKNPSSLRIVSLLAKPEAHKKPHVLDYVGFEISNDFVVGYGLDLNSEYRNLPDIMRVKLN